MSPRSESVNRELRKQSREGILAAALAVFAERGYEQSTISDITTRAGVSRGLISYYYPTKRDLLTAVLGRWLVGVFTIVEATKASGSPDERLATMIDAFLDAARDSLPVQRLALTLMLQPATREAFAEVEAEHADQVTAVEDALRGMFAARNAADPALEEVLLRSVLEGVIYKMAVYGDSYPLEAIRRRLHDMYGLPAGTADAAPAEDLRLRVTP